MLVDPTDHTSKFIDPSKLYRIAILLATGTAQIIKVGHNFNYLANGPHTEPVVENIWFQWIRSWIWKIAGANENEEAIWAEDISKWTSWPTTTAKANGN